MRKLLPVLLALAGLGAGIGAGLALKPVAEDAHALPEGEAPGSDAAESSHADQPRPGNEGPAAPAADREYVRLNNQFVVPVVSDGRVASLVVMSVSLEVEAGARETVFAMEPKLRDSFLQVLFDHANVGGFDGIFTTSNRLRDLRMALHEAAQSVLGATVSDVLIMDMVRQDT